MFGVWLEVSSCSKTPHKYYKKVQGKSPLANIVCGRVSCDGGNAKKIVNSDQTLEGKGSGDETSNYILLFNAQHEHDNEGSIPVRPVASRF